MSEINNVVGSFRRLSLKLFRDERGSVAVLSTIFLTVLLGIGVLAGVVILRDHLVQELGDVGVALDNLDQSFSYEINVCDDCVIAAQYNDDFATLEDPAGAPPACLVIDAAPSGENGTRPTPSGEFP